MFSAIQIESLPSCLLYKSIKIKYVIFSVGSCCVWVYDLASRNDKRSPKEDISKEGAEENFEPKKESNEMLKKITKRETSSLLRLL
jgi:hypothetical protein